MRGPKSGAIHLHVLSLELSELTFLDMRRATSTAEQSTWLLAFCDALDAYYFSILTEYSIVPTICRQTPALLRLPRSRLSAGLCTASSPVSSQGELKRQQFLVTVQTTHITKKRKCLLVVFPARARCSQRADTRGSQVKGR